MTMDELFLSCVSQLFASKDSVTVVVIGANTALEDGPLCWSRYLRQTDSVFALEPNPVAYEYLIRNVAGKQFPCRVHLRQYGIADTNGYAYLYQNTEEWGKPERTGMHGTLLPIGSSYDQECYVPCQFKTFATFLEDSAIAGIDLLMIDTEGYDYRILQQMMALQCFPAIVFYEYIHLERSMPDCVYRLSERYSQLEATRGNMLCLRKDIDWRLS